MTNLFENRDTIITDHHYRPLRETNVLWKWYTLQYRVRVGLIGKVGDVHQCLVKQFTLLAFLFACS